LKYEENSIQKQVLRWFKLQYPDLKDFLVAYVAGINLGIVARVRAAQMGLKAGMPDLQLYVPILYSVECTVDGELGCIASAISNFSAGLMVELKTPDGKLSKIQKEYHDKLRSQCYTIVTCYSFEEAVTEIKKYLEHWQESAHIKRSFLKRTGKPVWI
jgi:hypothetical protein